MSTYRKFDKYRQRADFASEVFYGADGTGLINSGTGTPVFTPGQAGGATFGTSSGGTGTSFLQRASTGQTPAALGVITARRGFKMNVVAGFDVEGAGITRTPEFGITIGAFGANANPLGQNGLGFTFRPSASEDYLSEVVAKVGATESTFYIDAHLDEFVHEGHLSAEMYYDGTDKIQFYLGRRRVAAADVANYDQLEDGEALFSTALSPTVGIGNNGGSTNSVRLALFGYAAQRAPYFGNF